MSEMNVATLKSELTQLATPGSNRVAKLEAFSIDTTQQPLRATLRTNELRCHCPVTNQPDQYDLTIDYAVAGKALETKSVKTYLWSFSDKACFAEKLAQIVAQAVADATGSPHVQVRLVQQVRGGITLTASAEAYA